MKVATENVNRKMVPENSKVISLVLQKKPKREVNAVMINFLYLNIRVLGDGWNRTMKLEQLEELGKQDAILLSETKCKTRLEPLGKLAF